MSCDCNQGRLPCKCAPPMRIGEKGDTVDRHGVRRKADGSLRNFTMDAIRWWGVCGWIAMMVLALASYVADK